MTIAPTLFFVVVVLIFSLLGGWLFGSKTHTLAEYFLMSRQLRSVQLGATFVAADMSVATVVLALGLIGYLYGFLAAVWITACWIGGIQLFLYFLAKPVFQGHIKDGYTLHELIGKYYDSTLGIPYVRIAASFVTIIVFVLTVGVEFFAGYVVFDNLPYTALAPFVPSPVVISVGVAIVVVIYTVVGGFRGTTRLNVYRLGLILVGLAILGSLPIVDAHHAVTAAVHTPNIIRLQPRWLLGVVLTLLPAQVSAMDMWQRCAAAAGEYRQVRRGLHASMPIYLIWLAPALVGAVAKVIGISASNPNFIVLEAVTQMRPAGHLWYWFLQPLLYGGLVATIASTADTLLNAVTFTYIFDIYPSLYGTDPISKSLKEQQDLVSAAKLWTAIGGFCAILVIFLGLFRATVYDLVAALFSVQTILFWPVLFIGIGHHTRNLSRNKRLATGGLIGGMVAAFGVLLLAVISHDRSLISLAPIAASLVTVICFGVVFARAPKFKGSNVSSNAT